jgi:PEP-CTERM motif
MKNTNRFLARIATTLAIATVPTLNAGELTTFSWHSGVASLAATTISPLTAPNNDDTAGASPNGVFVTQKNYIAIGPVDIVFNVINSGGTSEYLFTEGVYNNTGLNWGAYHIELGYGFDAGFVKSTPGDGLDFDAPDFNSPFNFNPGGTFFPSVSVTEDDVYANGGVMPYLSFAGYFRFTVDVPDGISSFTVRQSPIAVPEPSALGLLALGAVAFATKLRRNC